MSTLRHLEQYLAAYGPERNLFLAAFMVFFFVVFDGILMYLAPIVMQRGGISEGTMGLILGLSSVAGMLFDVILGRLLESSTYRTMFLVMLLVAATYPFFLFGATTVTTYLVAMAVWGLYYNLYNMGTIDFVGRTATPDRYTSSFGVLKVFDGLGYLIAPFIASLFLVAASTNTQMTGWLLTLLVPAFVFYFMFSTATMPLRHDGVSRHGNVYGILAEWHLWTKVGRILFPVLLLTLTINLVDSAVWTIGPLFSESLATPGGFGGGAFMIAYTLPPLLVGWIVGRFVVRFGKKKTALVALLVGSLLLTLIGIVKLPLLLIGIIFGTSFCFALAWPTMNAAYADDIAATPAYNKDIEVVEDWFTNVGDTLGPIAGGYAAQYVGNAHAFTIMGIFGAVASLVLLWYTPQTLAGEIIG